ncbi:amino acid permease [Opitutia bacterium ISCC 51]|nr:amino acid permease [Opitutae bacterium ISCC 51]QXD27203.1 amino acid permease [Opitutae bacterium ISCC 52]
MENTTSDEPQSPVSSKEKGPTLRRALGPRIAIAVVVGNVIGSGIFLKPGNIAAESGNFGLIISVWVFGGVLCILGALCLAELAAMLPKAGGMYVYIREAYGRKVAFLAGWNEFLFAKPASIGALSIAFTGSLGLSMGWQLSGFQQAMLATLVIILLSWVNIMGVLWGGRLQLAVTVVKALFLGLVAAIPFILIPFVEQSIQVSNYGTIIEPRQISLSAQVGVVLLAVMWAYNGWNGVVPLAEEIKSPQRNLPISLFAGIGILIALYLAANFAYHGVLSMEEMASAGNHVAEQMLLKLVGPAGMAAMSAVIMCSTFGAINTNLLIAPRVTFAMGRDGVFFRTLGRVHPEYQTPVPAILVTALMAIGLVFLVPLGQHLVRDVSVEEIASPVMQLIVGSLQDSSIFELLTNFIIFSLGGFVSLAVFAVIVLRFKQPDLARPYRSWGYPVTPVIFLSVYIWFMIQIYLNKPLESRIGLLFIALGIPVYFLYQKWSSSSKTER